MFLISLITKPISFLFNHKKLLLLLVIVLALWFFGFGFLGGWLLSRGSLERFPDLNSNDRVLILSPHMDDETISSGGIIQEALRVGAKVKIVFVTSGDSEEGVVARDNKSLNFDPNQFIALGEKRMNEARLAAKTLSLPEENLIFLGYAERGLSQMLSKYFAPETAYTSPWTKFSFNPFSGTYQSKQSYNGSNLVKDLTEIINNFNPTIIVVSHPRDQHPDHRAVYSFLEMVLSEEKLHPPVFAYLIHYHLFPPEKKLKQNQFLFPPKKLFTKSGWFSFNLTGEQEQKKLEATNQYISQRDVRPFYDLLRSFVKRNEIFEKFE